MLFPSLRSSIQQSRAFVWLGVLTGALALGLPAAFGAADDPFAVALPGRDTQAPEGLSFAGEGSVSEQQGSASFSYPIEVPPGRNGMAPSLALSYSSSAPLRGGIAAGWSLPLPTIERDPAFAVSDAPVYRLNLGDDSQILVETPGDPGSAIRYRPEFDDGFTRVARNGTGWTVNTPDGVTRTFSGASASSDGQNYWNLTSERDPFGNEVSYVWALIQSSSGHYDYLLVRAEYTSNAAAGLLPHAKVEFSWAPFEYCSGADIPKGAQSDHHFGVKRMRGGRRLQSIDTSVRDTPGGAWRTARRYTLSYDTNQLACGTDRPTLRYLTQLDVTAWSPTGVATSAPPVRFGYGPMKRDLSAQTWSAPGSGPGEFGTHRGPEAAFMDMNGDGINDQVRVLSPASSPLPPSRFEDTRCRLRYRRGYFGGGFDSVEKEISLPTAAWRGGMPVGLEACTLNGQYAARPWDYRDTGAYQCAVRDVEVAYHFLDWDEDGDLDLVTGTWTRGPDPDACGDFFCPTPLTSTSNNPDTTCPPCPQGTTPIQGTENCRCECGSGDLSTEGGCTPGCPYGQEYNQAAGECQGSCSDFDQCSDQCPATCPYEDPGQGAPGAPASSCNSSLTGELIWRVFRNETQPDGSPRFDVTTHETFQAVMPLPLNGGELARLQGGPASLPTYVDIDGDGWLDLIEVHDNGIWVYRGDGPRSFDTTEVVWSTEGRVNGVDGVVDLGNGRADVTSALRLIDMNGDGLPDLLFGTTNLAVAYNMDGWFAPTRDLGLAGPVERSRIEITAPWSIGMPLDTGWRAQTRRIIDVDDDGLPEVLAFTVPGSGVSDPYSQRKLYRFDGNPFSGSYTFLGDEWEPTEQLVRAINGRAWYRANQDVDITGDGQADMVTWTSDGLGTVRTDPAGGDPQRLLTTVDNGRGGVTRFRYGVATDPAVVTTSGEPNQPRWVVKQVTVSSGQNQPDIRTSYRYATPVSGWSSRFSPGPRSFLGFGQVTVERSGQLGDSSSRTTKLFDYNVENRDHRGHLSREQTDLRSGSTWIPVSATETDWDNKTLLDGAVSFSYRKSITSLSYRADGSSAAMSFAREHWEERTWFGGQVVHYENTESSSGIGTPADPPLHVIRRQFQPRLGQSPYGTGDYRILPTVEEQLGLENGQLATLSKTTTTYSTVPGLPIETKVETGGQPARTLRTFDEVTGLLLTIQRPNQVAAGSNKVTRVTYDAHQLFIERTVNELGHTVIEKHDVATGALLRQEGPNYRSVPMSNCVPTKVNLCFTTVYEPTVWTIDGFGRPLTRSVATEPNNGSGYATTTVEWNTFIDLSIPNRRVTEQLRDWGTNTRLRSEHQFDGAGRVVREIAYSGQAGLLDAVTTYDYDAGGALRLLGEPDPRVDTGALVYHTLMRDGLGRVVEVIRPDGTREKIAYDGLEQRTWTSSPSEGDGAQTDLVHDALGRLVQVHEYDNPEPDDIAVTTYTYDALDRMTRIVDADGAATALGYDLRGLRTSVTRGSRSWIYVYDPDGNMTSECSPVPSGGVPTDYCSTSIPDELGRVRMHTPARRGMTDARLQQLAAGPVASTYDTGANGIGRLAGVYHARTGSTTPQWKIDYTYGLRGELLREQRAIDVTYREPTRVNATQWVDRTYDATGAPVDVTWDDGTTWRNVYDGRGMLDQLRWYEPGIGYRTLVDYTRSVAGQPRLRSSYYDQRRSWTYDVLGRIDVDHVYRASTGATLADRGYTYDDFGLLLGVSGTVDGRLADADYEYDRRGRVTSAHVSTAYAAAFNYSAAGNVRSAIVTGSMDTPTRNVTYQYGARDPHAVDRLNNAGNGTALATLTYDMAGNLITRQVPAGTWQLTWDGDDQLREAVGPTGTETYYYNGPDRLLAIQPDGVVKFWFGESETHFVNGSAMRRYHHLTAGEPIARIENRSSIELQYADTLENLSLTVSSSGAVTSSFLYGAFGEQVAATGTLNHRRQFNGKESDAATGLHFYGYRSYDPLLLRWISADPLYRVSPDMAWSEPQRANLYTFSMNNPLLYRDPDGRDTCKDGVCIGEAETDMGGEIGDFVEGAKDGIVDRVTDPKTAFFTICTGCAMVYQTYEQLSHPKETVTQVATDVALDKLTERYPALKFAVAAVKTAEAYREGGAHAAGYVFANEAIDAGAEKLAKHGDNFARDPGAMLERAKESAKKTTGRAKRSARKTASHIAAGGKAALKAGKKALRAAAMAGFYPIEVVLVVKRSIGLYRTFKKGGDLIGPDKK